MWKHTYLCQSKRQRQGTAPGKSLKSEKEDAIKALKTANRLVDIIETEADILVKDVAVGLAFARSAFLGVREENCRVRRAQNVLEDQV